MNMKNIKTFELFGIGQKQKITIRDRNFNNEIGDLKDQYVEVGVGDLVVYKEYMYSYSSELQNEGTFIIKKILSNGNVLLTPAPEKYQLKSGFEDAGTPNKIADLSGVEVSPKYLVWYGKKRLFK